MVPLPLPIATTARTLRQVSRSKRKKKGPASSAKSSSDQASKQGKNQSDTDSKADEQVPAWTKVRENIEAILVAIILALIIRHFSLEAFEIPTGSMAPGLHGVHVDTTCPNCETKTSVGIETDSQSGKVAVFFKRQLTYSGDCPECGCYLEDLPQKKGAPTHCPSCATHRPSAADGFETRPSSQFYHTCPECSFKYREVFGPKDCLGGHKILVNKFVYEARDPQRWEVIVFKFNRQRNYIKRLVGLPGERIQIREGDIWINGKVERKPPSVQEEMWFPVHDSDIVEKGFVKRSAWDGHDKGWAPAEEALGYEFNALDAVAYLEYQRAIHSGNPYNGKSSGRWNHPRVYDLRIAADVNIRAGNGQIELHVINGVRRYRCILGVGSGSRIDLVQGDEEDNPRLLHDLPSLKLQREEDYALDFYLADRCLVLSVNREILAEVPLPDDIPGKPDQARNTVGILAKNIGGSLTRARVFRDLWYTNRGKRLVHATSSEYQIPENGYFAMGDNSDSSLDSRAWGALSGDNLLGRAFTIFWPALPWRWEIGFIR